MDMDNVKVWLDGVTDKPYVPEYNLIARFGWEQIGGVLGYSFGNIYFLTDEKGVQYIDTENLSKETVKQMICKLIDEAEML